MPLSWNEIRNNAHHFAREWANADSERADAQTFWNEFFEVFGIPRKRVAIFEKTVEITRAGEKVKDGRIDAFWKGELLIEHKSAGRNLDKAFAQAADYFDGLPARDLPRRILVSDFKHFRLYDLEENSAIEFPLGKLHENIAHFGFIAGYQLHRTAAPEEAADIKAAEQLGKLHDQLKAVGYVGHPLEVLLVRMLFCMFAEDTGIFERSQFRDYLELRTAEDGSDLGMHLTALFQVLNTPIEQRLLNLDEQLAAFAYINGRLFSEHLPVPAFDRDMRETLLDACGLNWSRISPAIFGSLFQSIMDKKARRNLGAHYTREVNILKALRPLFLDALREELAAIGSNTRRLLDFQRKLASIRVLDPACGCGNFLVIAYRELRRMELEVLHRLHKKGASSRTFDIKSLVFVDVDQFYGIEIEEFPAQIAQVALWLTDHQINLEVSEEFGHYFARLPLTKSPNIVRDNALRIAWQGVVKPQDLSYIVGNPPFVGKHYRSAAQRADLLHVADGLRAAGDLDYVAAWYLKAADYIRGTSIRCALVSTSSITQGEQVPVLWPALRARGIRIHFAHRTFQWSSEAAGAAAVHCVIIGFGLDELPSCRLFEYDSVTGDPHEHAVSEINAYLIPGDWVIVHKRQDPFDASLPAMRCGNKPTDDGNLLLTEDERDALLREEPSAAQYIKRFLGTDEYLYGTPRYCLWLDGASPADIRNMPAIAKRVAAVRAFRLASTATPTQRAAAYPARFFYVSQPKTRYILMPEVSSERRAFIPVGFMEPDVIASNKVYIIAQPSLFIFGVLQSTMHMAWVRTIGGRLESRYQYSGSMLYNTFPWPAPTEKQRVRIDSASQAVLDIRSQFPGNSLADLYDPVTMPQELAAAHRALDSAVDAAYGKTGFRSEADRVSFLFGLYQGQAAPVVAAAQAPTRRRASSRARR